MLCTLASSQEPPLVLLQRILSERRFLSNLARSFSSPYNPMEDMSLYKARLRIAQDRRIEVPQVSLFKQPRGANVSRTGTHAATSGYWSSKSVSPFRILCMFILTLHRMIFVNAFSRSPSLSSISLSYFSDPTLR